MDDLFAYDCVQKHITTQLTVKSVPPKSMQSFFLDAWAFDFSESFVDGQCKALILQSILGMLHVLVPRQNNLGTFEPVFFFDLRVVPFLILHSTYQNY